MNYSGAGFILFTPDFRVLLVQDAKTQKWGFPKGHREDTDLSDLHTAERELLEETGIPPTSYTVYDHPFRIIRGSASYIFRYAILNDISFLGAIQCSREISGMQWISLVQFYLNPECIPIPSRLGGQGNKYLRTWIADIVTHADRKTYHILQSLTNKVLGIAPSSSASSHGSISPPVSASSSM